MTSCDLLPNTENRSSTSVSSFKWLDVLCIIVFMMEKSMDVIFFVSQMKVTNATGKGYACGWNALIERDMIAMTTRQHWMEKTQIGFGTCCSHLIMEFPKISCVRVASV